jgi:hypothetical protein
MTPDGAIASFLEAKAAIAAQLQMLRVIRNNLARMRWSQRLALLLAALTGPGLVALLDNPADAFDRVADLDARPPPDMGSLTTVTTAGPPAPLLAA